ncbi:Furin-like protease 2 [Halotydeus destructor]|nr:Furin-like protease 2 [Halotydeus destructor]
MLTLVTFLVFVASPLTVSGFDDRRSIRDADNREYTNHFAIHVDPAHDAEQVANEVAERYGFVNKGQIGSLDGHFLLEHNRVSKRSTEYAHSHHSNLKEDPRVIWVEQQHIKRRVKRDNQETDVRYSAANIVDPLYKEQWYLNHGARGGFDMNVAGAWARGYTGKGIVVTILDDGIQPNHPDLVANYDPQASMDINDNDNDPTPQDNGDNKHGTRCAGEVAAMAYNEFCGVGVAFNASIGGVRMLDGTVTDEVEAKALSLNPDHVDIYSASWGPEDDGKTVDGPGRLAQRAFQNGIARGRKGLGSIFVWASGNGGRKQDSCNCDGYTNSIYTLSISSATQHGAKPWYLEECSSTLASTYSSGTPGSDQNVVTVDMDTSYFNSLRQGRTPAKSSLCTLSHTGTSASAPIAAGIAALALEANPRLTWRDMQHIVVATSRYEPVHFESGWVTNGIGRKVSHKFGYGLMDAEAIVKLAERWQTSPPQRVCETSPDNDIHDIPADNNQQLEVTLSTKACQGTSNEIKYLEHVQARLTLQFKPRGNLKITLISPSGTPSDLLLPRPRDLDESSFNNWPFLSVHFWGEQPQGTWKLYIKSEGSRPSRWPGKLISWSLVFFGTVEKPFDSDLNKNATFHKMPRSFSADKVPLNSCAKNGKFQDIDGQCVDTCQAGYFGDNERKTCVRCSEECSSCYGPSSDNCLGCSSGKFYYGNRCLNVCPDTHYADQKLAECLPCSINCRTCNEEPAKCKTCRSKLKLDESQRCIPSCNGTACSQCLKPCKTCFDSSRKGCVSCMDGYRLLLNECILGDCPSGHYLDQNGNQQCRQCHRYCTSCTGPSHTQCTKCVPGTTSRKGLCEPCRDGEFLTGTSCQRCHSNCATCSGPLAADCTSCESPTNLNRGKCVPCCRGSSSPRNLVANSNECCKCYNSAGPCIVQEHTRSVYGVPMVDGRKSSESWLQLLFRRPNAVIASVCVISALLFASVFVVLQLVSRKREAGYRDYRKLSTRYDIRSEKISLTQNDEEDSLYAKT